MDWKRRFYSTDLTRGKNYYRSGRVHDLKETEEGNQRVLLAKVQGTRLYKTEVIWQDGELVAGDCSCPVAATGRTCKHMAAVCFAEEENQNKRRKEREKTAKQERERLEEQRQLAKKQVFPFPEPPKDGKYRYFRFDRLTKDMLIYDVDMEDAGPLRNQVSMSCDYNGYSGYEGQKTTLKIRASMYVGTSLTLSADGITELRCGEPECKGWDSGFIDKENRRPCRHTLAMLLEAEKQARENDWGDATSLGASRLLKDFSMEGLPDLADDAEELNEKTPALRLIPRVFVGGQKARFGFKIGHEKLYVLKDIDELLYAEKTGAIYPIGKTDEANFANETFDAASMPLFEMLRDVQQAGKQIAEQMADKYYYHGNGYRLIGEMIAADRQVDALYDYLGKGGEADFPQSGKGSKGVPLRRGRGEADISFTLSAEKDEDGELRSMHLTGRMPEVVSGEKNVYGFFADEGSARMYVLPKKTGLAAARLAQAGMTDPVDLQIGRRNLMPFCRDILPVLRQCFDLDEQDTEVLGEYIPPEAEFGFYMDAQQDKILCRPMVCYGEKQFNMVRETGVGDASRDARKERSVYMAAFRYFSQIDSMNGCWHLPRDDDDQVFRLLDKGLPVMRDLGEVYMTDAFRRIGIRSTSPVSVGVSVSGDLLDLEIRTEDMEPKELLQLLAGYRLKKRYHRMADGSFVRLDGSMGDIAEITDAMRLGEKELAGGHVRLPAYRALYLDQMLEKSEEIAADRDASFRRLVKNFKTVNESDFEVPASLKPVLRKYQVQGYRWMRTLASCGFGGILADDMGLGKTVQAIAVMLAAVREGETRPSAVVCPASLVYNWREEFLRFAPELKVCVVAGTKKEREEQIRGLGSYHVMITSYDLLKRDIECYANTAFAYEFIDEAQFIKTQTTAAAKSVKVLSAEHRFALTGTPIENRLSELWSIFDYLMPGFLYTYTAFRKEMETPIVKKTDDAVSERLRRMVSPFILRRLKGDVLKDLPEKLEEVRYAHMEDEQRHLYDAQALRITNLLEKTDEADLNRSKIAILAELTRIRQICCDPHLLFEDYRGESAKRALCLDLIESAADSGHRMLVFSQFTSMLALLESDLTERGIEYFKIVGDTPKAERVELVKRFNDGDTPVFLISLKAGGTGLNLTGADVVIHYDPWWNVAAQNQATDRAHRIGQTKEVTVYRLIAKDSIEEKILKLQNTKKALADEILTGESTSLSSMSKEELLELIGQ